MTEAAFAELQPLVKTKQACRLLGKPRATHYRRLRPGAARERRRRPTPPNALSPAERQAVLDAVHRPEHADLPAAQVWARLIDEGAYLASISTMYRLLRLCGESRDRRRQRTHPARTKPQLLAKTPNEVWSCLRHRGGPVGPASRPCRLRANRRSTTLALSDHGHGPVGAVDRSVARCGGRPPGAMH